MLSKNQIKFIHSLENKKSRQQERIFVAEGVKIISELLKSDFQVTVIYCTEKFLPQLAPDIIKKNVRMEFVSESELQKISQLETNSAALALVQYRDLPPLNVSKNEALLILDGINDPGNLGTIIRTAEWFGIKNIYCSENTVDVYNLKVINSSMGSMARVNVYYGNIVEFLRTANFDKIYGTFLNGTPIEETIKRPDSSTAIIMGSESHGISKEVEKLITDRITIKGKGKAESLNVGISCGIVLYELLS